ncbi:HAD-IC family P-type ATPase [Longivirga aurantiaca]|uniref:HAD-IC family P-type ATPase n=1 Tax=Longivirga aurantiaca TaxID=1837743 RepID=A0ABW1SXF3_9ACTN
MTAPTREVVDPARGLSAAEVAERVATGRVNAVKDRNARSLGDIVRANTFTYFNALIGFFWVLMLVSAPLIDSLFGLVIVVNTAIGIIQEYRAARTLAKLSLVGLQQPTVRRDGVDAEIATHDLVLDDVILLRTGDQMLVDSVVLESNGLELDESLLTGEADPVAKEIGDDVLSGSFVVAGSGVVRATRVGHDSYASKIADEASKFSVTRSELRYSIQRFIKVVSWFLVPVGFFLFISQYRANDGDIRASIAGTVPGVITMVPEGLVLLTSVAMAVSVIRLAQKKALVQDMPAVEVLARVDVVCVDKTGTLTEPGMAVQQVVTIDDSLPVADALGALGASEPEPNQTLVAIAAKYPATEGWTVTATVPFSSSRKWSSATFGDRGAWVLGAPEMLLPDGDPVRTQADGLAQGGARVLVLASSAGEPSSDDGAGDLSPAALVVINQTLRSDAAETVAYFLEQNVKMKVISGDNAVTVGAIAAQAGVPGADTPVDARDLPDDQESLAEILETHSVFGRVTPAQKRAMVGALQSRGHVVAMTGDGVNDCLALKDADLGIAMGSGAGATRAVAQIVLLDDRFAVMPSVVAEGRRVLGNVERVAQLFLSKSFYAMVVSLATILLTLPFPFLNRHLTIVTALTIGVPAFFLALLPNTERFRPGFFGRVLVFAIPCGLVCALSAYATYGYVLNVNDGDVDTARTAAVTTLFIVAWWILMQVAKPWDAIRLGICGAMLIGFVGVLYIPWLSNLFQMSWAPDHDGLAALAIGIVGATIVSLLHAFVIRGRQAAGGDLAPAG